MMISPAAIHKALHPTTCTLWMMADSTGSWAMRNRSSMSDDNTISATNKIRMNLARALSSSTRALGENIRLSPAAGFMRLNLGAMLLAANSQPPRATGPISAARSKVIKIGCTARIAIFPECSRYCPMAPGLSSTSRGKLKLSFINSMRSSAKPPP